MSKPKEILIEAVNTFLLEKLEAQGFKFFEKSVKFKKKNQTSFNCEINFLGSRTNWLDELVNFKVQYLVHVPRYKSWHKKNFPGQSLIGGAFVNGDRRLINQRTAKNALGFGYDFVKFEAKDIMEEIWKNYFDYGKKYFESASDWQMVFLHADRSITKIDSLIFQNKNKEALSLTKERMDEVLKPNDAPEHIQVQLKRHYDVYKSRFEYLKRCSS